MSLDITIKFKQSRLSNYFLEHPYWYENLSEYDQKNYSQEEEWRANITHNLGRMAKEVPIYYDLNGMTRITTLYYLLWRPEECDKDFTNTSIMEEYLIQGIKYMMVHRLELLEYESSNGWGTYNGFMKFLLNFLQACQDNPGCKIEVSR